MTSSKTLCSSNELTSLSVEATCCASTTRHGLARKERRLEVAPHCVQILADMDQSRNCLHELRRNPVEVKVFGVKPRPALVRAPADDRIQAAKNSQEENRQLPLFAVRLHLPQALDEPRQRRLAHAQNPREMLLRNAQQVRSA